MAKKNLTPKKEETLIQKTEKLDQTPPEGIHTLIKDFITSQGKTYTQDVGNKILEEYDHNYDRLIEDSGNALGVSDIKLPEYKNKVWDQYKIKKPSPEFYAERDFVKTPVTSDPEGGLEQYDKLRVELKAINDSIANYGGNIDSNQEEPSDEDILMQKRLPSVQSDATKTVIPNENIAESDSKMLSLQQKKKEIEQALNEQYGHVLNQASKFDIEEPKIDPEAESNYFKDLGISLYKGAAAVSQGIVRLPATMYRVAAWPQNAFSLIPGLEALEVSKDKNSSILNFLDENKITDYYDNAVEEQRSKISQYEQSITEQWKSGDITGALKTVGVQAAESIPITLALMASGGFGVTTEAGIGIGAYATTQKLHELDERNPDLHEATKVVNAVFSGIVERYTESMSMGSIGIGKNLLKREGSDALKKLTKKSFIQTFNPIVKSIYNVSSPMIGEGLTEAAATYSENYIDYLSGIRPEGNLREGVMDAFLVGTVAGGTISGPISTYHETVTNPIARSRVKTNYTKAQASLDDITNGNYAESIENIANNHETIEQTQKAFKEVNTLYDISVNDAAIASNYIISSINYQNTSNARKKAVKEKIEQQLGQDGNVTLVQHEGQSYSVRNPQDLRQDGKVIFLKDKEGNVKPVISSKLGEVETKTPEQIIDETLETQDQDDVALEEEQRVQEEMAAKVAEKGLEEGKTVITPQGKQKLISVNPDGTSTVENAKGEQLTVNTDEIEAYKTQEQKTAEKEADKAEIEEQKVVSEEPLFEGSEVIVTDFANGTSVIKTPEGEQTFDNKEDRDAAVQELAQAELEASEETIDNSSPEQVFSETYQTDPELAIEALTMEIEVLTEKAQDIRQQAKEAQSSKERVGFLKQAKELEAESVRLNGIIEDPTQLQTTEETISEQPSVDSETKPLSQEEAVSAPIEEETAQIERTPDTIYGEWQQEQDKAPINQLLPWQEGLLGKRVSRESFINFGDRNNITKNLARTWFAPKADTGNSTDIDIIAQELSEDGVEVTTDDIVNFITENPKGTPRKITDAMNELQAEYKELTGKPISKHVKPIATTQEEAGTPFRISPGGITVTEKAKEDITNKTRIEPILNKLQEEFGIPIKLINSSEQSQGAKDKAVELGLQAISDKTNKTIEELSNDPEMVDLSLKIGTPTGYYDQSTSQAVIISDRASAESISELKKTYFHEAILHKGLDMLFDAGPVTILGKTYDQSKIVDGKRISKEGKNLFMLEVFSRLDSETIADRAKDYAKGVDLNKLTDEQKVELAEEVLATINEDELLRSPRLQVLIDKLYNFFKKITGHTSKQFTKDELMGVLREHRNLLKKQVETSKPVEAEVKEEVTSKQPAMFRTNEGQTFDEWKGDNEYVEDYQISDVKTGEKIVAKAYHGTTHDITEFKGGEVGNIEGHLGKTNYFTSEYGDAEQNYGAEGADLTGRIEQTKERIEQELEDEYTIEDIDAIKEQYDLTDEDLDRNIEDLSDIAYAIAEKELKGKKEQVLEVYIKLNNPLVLGSDPVYIDSIDEVEIADYMDDAAQEIADEYDVSIDEAKEDYSGEIQIRAIENSGAEDRVVEAMRLALEGNEVYDKTLHDFLPEYYGEKVDLNQIDTDLRASEELMYIEDPETGELASYQIISDFYEELGYDGVILTDVNERFSNMNLYDGVSHIHVPDQYNNQIKLADGSNTTFGETSDIRFRVTETPEFKKWFGNSQIVDEKGIPQVYYHATGEDFDAFKTQSDEQIFGKGVIFASPDSKWAQEGFMPVDKDKGTSGSVMPVYVKAENPFDYRNEEHLNKLFESVELRDKAKDHVANGRPMGLEKPKVIAAIKELGYDGLYVTEEGMTNIGVFNPNQVKSATGNKGTFDSNTDDVSFRVASSQKELEDFVKDSKVKETVYHGSPDARGILADKEYQTVYQRNRNALSKEAEKTIDDEAVFFFTSSYSTANSYADDRRAFDYQNAEPKVLNNKINIQNPLQINAGNSNWRKFETEIDGEKIKGTREFIEYAKNKGYDSIIINNVKDNYNNTAKTPSSTVYAVFNNDQILIEPKEDVRFRVEEERDKVEINPSEAQKDAGNYSKGHIKLDGFDISIENPKGSIRKGTNETGEEWSSIMPADYGYFKGTIGKDKDHIDTYLGDNLESDKVYVVDQVNPETGAFDEHKVMIGYNSLAEAKNAYMEAYEEGWQGLGAITRTTKDGLKEWFKGDTKKPFAPAEDVKFQVKSDDPKVQAMLDKLAKVQELSKTTARIKGMENEKLQSLGPQRKFMEDKINLYKEAVAEGKTEAKEMIKEVQTAITDYAKKALPLTEAGAREISPVLTLIKNAQTPEDVEKAINRIDELVSTYKRKQTLSIINDTISLISGIKIIDDKNTDSIKRLKAYNEYASILKSRAFSNKDKLEAQNSMSEEDYNLWVDNKRNQLKINKKEAFNNIVKLGASLTMLENKTLIDNVLSDIVDFDMFELNDSDKQNKSTDKLKAELKSLYVTLKEYENQQINNKRKHVAKVNRLLKWMTGLKKSGNRKVGIFNYEDTMAFQELKKIDKTITELTKTMNSNKATTEEKTEAESKLNQEWETLNAKENKTSLDDVMMKLIELRRLGAKASPALAKATAEELEAIYSEAKDAKSEADIEKALVRSEAKEDIIKFIEGRPLESKVKSKRVIAALNNLTADAMGNWDTLMSMLTDKEGKDKYSFILPQVNQDIGVSESINRLLDKGNELYLDGKKGIVAKTKLLNYIHSLADKNYELIQPIHMNTRIKGISMKLSKRELMDIYNAVKQEEIADNYYLAYGDPVIKEDGSRDYDKQKEIGEERIDSLLDNLKPEDKAFADFMQQELSKYYDRWNEVFIKLNNRDLPRNDNYWPSSAYNQKDLDVLQTAYVQSNTPGATQERTNRRTPIPKDAFSKFQQHIKEAEWFVNMAMPIHEANKVLSDPSVENLIKQGMGNIFYTNLNQSLSNIGLTPPQKAIPSSKLEGFFDRRLNDWVAAKIGLTLSVPIKQLLSVVNYSENMPIGKWGLGFTKAAFDPVNTWKQMMTDVPYLKTRLGSGYSEAMHRALQGDEELARSKSENIHQAFKNVMTIGTRYGDIAAIIFGGKPYLDYLINEGMKKDGAVKEEVHKEAVDKFLKDTLTSQQSPYSSTLSKFQNSKNFAYRALFAFANTPSQYMRKLFEANQNFKKAKAKFKSGGITKQELNKERQQLVKVHSIYAAVNGFAFVLVGNLITSLMKGSEPDDELVIKSTYQALSTYVAGLPIIKDLVESVSRESLGMRVYDDVSPITEGLDKGLREGIKAIRGDESKTVSRKDHLKKSIQYLLEAFGAPAKNFEKQFNRWFDKEETFRKTRVKEVDNELKDLKDSKNPFEARKSKELKQAYSTAKGKATRLRNDGKILQADRIDRLIEDSKLRLRDNKYKGLGSELRMFEARLEIID